MKVLSPAFTASGNGRPIYLYLENMTKISWEDATNCSGAKRQRASTPEQNG
jgi:hypothetical protein